MNQPSLFDPEPARPKPIAKATQLAALASAQVELHPNVRAIAASLFYTARQAHIVDGKVVGGLTIQELAVKVSERRGKHTKETSITQALKDLRGGDIFDGDGNLIRSDPVFVRDSGLTRIGNDGKACTVWEHTYVIPDAADEARKAGTR